jgi:hypothetical protein
LLSERVGVGQDSEHYVPAVQSESRFQACSMCCLRTRSGPLSNWCMLCLFSFRRPARSVPLVFQRWSHLRFEAEHNNKTTSTRYNTRTLRRIQAMRMSNDSFDRSSNRKNPPTSAPHNASEAEEAYASPLEFSRAGASAKGVTLADHLPLSRLYPKQTEDGINDSQP